MTEIKEFWQSLNKFYFYNIMLGLAIVISIMFTYFMQFKVEALQDKIALAQSQIADYKDKIRLLEVEWVYLTRPERLRNLAGKYLKDNGYTLASQIKNDSQLEKYYLATYKKDKEEVVASTLSF